MERQSCQGHNTNNGTTKRPQRLTWTILRDQRNMGLALRFPQSSVQKYWWRKVPKEEGPDMQKSKYSINGQPGRAEKLSHTKRFRIELTRLEHELEQRQIEYEEACRLRQTLSSRVDLLNALTSNSSRAGLLQQIVLRTISLKSPLMASPWEASPYGMSFDALPSCLSLYDDSLLCRMTRMTPGDLGNVYRSFLVR